MRVNSYLVSGGKYGKLQNSMVSDRKTNKFKLNLVNGRKIS